MTGTIFSGLLKCHLHHQCSAAVSALRMGGYYQLIMTANAGIQVLQQRQL